MCTYSRPPESHGSWPNSLAAALTRKRDPDPLRPGRLSLRHALGLIVRLALAVRILLVALRDM